MEYNELKELLEPYIKRYAIVHQDFIKAHIEKPESDEVWDEMGFLVKDFWQWIKHGAIAPALYDGNIGKRKMTMAIYDGLCRAVRDVEDS